METDIFSRCAAFGERNADTVLLQPVDGRELPEMEEEYRELSLLTERRFLLLC